MPEGTCRIAERVDGAGAEPDDEAGLVQAEDQPTVRACDEEHPTPEERQCREYEHRRDQHALERGGWSELDVRPGATVVPREAVTGAEELERDRTEQEHADEDVHREQ